jgi:hypothetical protein
MRALLIPILALWFGAGGGTGAGGNSCTSAPLGNWTSTNCTGGNASSTNEFITVPVGNSGSIDIVVDAGSTGPRYVLAGGGAVNLPVGATTNITAANGDSLNFQLHTTGTCAAATGDFFTGTVKDHTTGATLDTISLHVP